MLVITSHQLERLLDFPTLIEALRQGFASDIITPQRHHHDFDQDSTLLLMPSWQTGHYLGVKLITMCPKNKHFALPSIQGLYLLFNAETGEPLAQIDAPCLTNLRTAGASALASHYLSRPDASNFLLVGTGSLAPYLLRAHAAVRNFSRLRIWGRNQEKAALIANGLQDFGNIEVISDLETAVRDSDVISVATLSSEPVVLGDWLSPGVHLDLVGSYKPSMRETDDRAMERAGIFIDTNHALQETGDLLIPLKQGTITEQDIKGSLIDLCRDEVSGRTGADQITLFKSVGHASEDLIAGVMAYEQYGSIF